MITFSVALLAGCNKDSVDANQCYECVTKITYSGSQYVPAGTSVSSKVCGTAQKDNLIRQNGTTTATSGGITIRQTTTSGCRKI